MNSKILVFFVGSLMGATCLDASQPTKRPKSTEQKMQEVRKKFMSNQPQRKRQQKVDLSAIQRAEKENKELKATYRQLKGQALDLAPLVLNSRESALLTQEFSTQENDIQEAVREQGPDELMRLQEENSMYEKTNEAMISIINDLLAKEQVSSGRTTREALLESERRQQELKREDEEGEEE